MMDKPNDMLIEAERRAHKARLDVFAEHIDDPVGLRLLARLGGDLVFRSLLELELNGCTSFRGTQILMAGELVSLQAFKIRTGPFRGRECSSLQITGIGMAMMFEEQDGLEDNRWLEYLRGSVLGYACIDDGRGICATREFLETSIEIDDLEILKRCVHPYSGTFAFPEAWGMTGKVDAKTRASASKWWSSNISPKRSSVIISLQESV
ncbi:hypothetical protein R3X27_09720 [Tropicimonas sp. TH_r6]|uniref:hypothetical protein n=1 Tax=Tropicimonas sp. TH_r6 TaxID=3082085 RepID=UPI002953DC0C|nr:hypothetical protein [Tropicimonas sp. TH_r6]MDV7142963.1 hypothetical protein [Tropicimonas sp. TH_r6]